MAEGRREATGEDDEAAVRRLFAQQSGLATVTQLRAHGMSAHILRRRLQRQWQYVLPRVVLAGRPPLTDQQRLVAALLFAGEGAVLTSLTAASWHGVRAVADVDHRVHVAIPADRCVRDQGFVVVRRTIRPDVGAWNRQGLLIASPARAVADAARDAGDAAARRIVIEAVQRRLVSVPALRHELVAGPRAGAADLRRALADAELGAWSVPEADLARIVHASGRLPPMWANPQLWVGGQRLPTPDGWFDDVALAVQVHSRQFHAGELDWEATVSADGVFAEHGIPVVAVTPRQIAVEPAEVLRRIGRAHEAAGRRPRPAVVATPITAA